MMTWQVWLDAEGDDMEKIHWETDGQTNATIVLTFVITILSTDTVWPDLTKFRHFGKISQICEFLRSYLVFGKI